MTSITAHPVHREGFHSLRASGLNWDTLPLRLFSKGNAKFWTPPTSTSAGTPRTGSDSTRSSSATLPACARSSSPARRP